MTIFSAKINKVFLSPILQNLKGRSVLDKCIFENDPHECEARGIHFSLGPSA